MALSESPVVYAKAAEVKAAIRTANTTGAAVARTAGINRTVLSEWIHGTRELRRDQVAVLAHVLNTSIDTLAEDGVRCPNCQHRMGRLAVAA